MGFYLVTMSHPDGEAWDKYLAPHVQYLNMLVARGVLKASGPLKNVAKRTGFLIFKAESAEEVHALVDADPFAIEGLIETLSVIEWDPLFGEFADESTGSLAGRPVEAFN